MAPPTPAGSNDAKPVYARSGASGARWLVVSAVAVVGLGALLWALARSRQPSPGRTTLTVYCAAGIKDPVLRAAEAFTRELGVEVDLRYGNSGGLLSSIELRPEGDLYIAADAEYVARGRQAGLLAESIPIARFRLVLAVRPGNPRGIRSLADLLSGDDLRWVICNPEAGAGAKTREHLEPSGHWDAVSSRAKTRQPTVVAAAEALATSDVLDAGFIWDSTARQFSLDIIDLPELSEAVAEIPVAVLAASQAPADALRFARWLASPEHGSPAFRASGYEPIPGDPWAVAPELQVPTGGVNRTAIVETFRAFEAREGCIVRDDYAGCGTLVGKIEASPTTSSIFLTCDATYLDMVADLFLEPVDVSQTSVIILSRREAGIRSLDDLARPGVSVGLTRPEASALGARSVRLLEAAGLWDRVAPNVRVYSPTAHELVLQIEAGDKLDAVLVYTANVAEIATKDAFEIVPIDRPEAIAVQNVAVARNCRYPQLARRLVEAIRSSESRQRFTSNGFSWRGDDPKAP